VLLDLFGQAAPAKPAPAASPGPQAAAPPVPEKPKVVELLGGDRAKQMTIRVFSKIRRPNEDIVKAVVQLDEALTEDVLEALRDTAPTDEEIAQIEAYDGNREQLARPEKFVLVVATAKLYQAHVSFLLLKRVFPAQFGTRNNLSCR
jgi:flagellar motility protein MotE (MotC chaperone)